MGKSQCFEYADLDWKKYVTIDERLYRPDDVTVLRGDYSKARNKLGWEPKIIFKDLVKMMVDADLKRNGKML